MGVKLKFVILILGLAIFAGLGVVRANKSEREHREATLRQMGNSSNSTEKLKTPKPITANPLPTPLAAATPEDQHKYETLNEILLAKNDNDPRLDTELRKLSPGAKDLFRTRYDSLNPELRNERGTVVYLLGRNLSSKEDVEFLRKVLEETPCRSLADCQRNPDRVAGADEHLEAANETTLAYPQIVALKSLEGYLSRPDADPKVANEALRKLQTAQSSSIPVVAQMAKEILARTHVKG